MEIKPFKMRVTPEQSRIVQQTLFSNNYTWFSGDTTIRNLSSPHLYFYEDTLRQTEDFQEDFFVTHKLPELTFQEFFDTYVKWCIRGSKELAHWERTAMKGACDAFLNHPDYYYVPKSDNLLFWNAWRKVPENHIELTFEQFKQYVLKTKESKDMEKKIIRYKVPFDLFNGEVKAGFIYKPLASISNKYYAPINLEGKVGLPHLNLPKEIVEQWEPVYEQSFKELYFGKVKFTIKKGDNSATTEYGKVTKEEIKNAIDYIENPPKLTGNTLSIHYNSTYCKITELDNNGTLSYGFGCQAGSLKELKAIYNAFE